MKTKYSEKLKDPRWQKKRLGILARDEWHCQQCYDSEDTLVVHHLYYERDREPWDYPDEALITLCESCHEQEREDLNKAEARLFAAVRKCFLARDIDTIAIGFEDLAKIEPARAGSEYAADAIATAISDREMLNQIFHNWHNTLKNLHQQRKENRDENIQ